jgi:hypothetical protein
MIRKGDVVMFNGTMQVVKYVHVGFEHITDKALSLEEIQEVPETLKGEAQDLKEAMRQVESMLSESIIGWERQNTKAKQLWEQINNKLKGDTHD